MKYTRETLPRIEEELQEMIPRWRFIYWLLIGSAIVLTGRLWYLQVLHGEKLRQYSERNRLKEIIIPAERGWILDRHLQTLVNNVQGLELTLTPQYIHSLSNTAEQIAPIINKLPAYIIKKVELSKKQYGPFQPVTIKKHLTIQMIVHLKSLQWDLPGMEIRQTIIRNYPLKKNGAHLFGYMGEISKKQIKQFNKKYGPSVHFQPGDLVGKNGLELMWEDQLHGEDGYSFVEVDVHNRKSRTLIAGLWSFKPKQAIRGNNLVLTIDKDLQKQAYKSLLRKDKIGLRYGSVTVMKTNGEILATCSSPSYNPNIFSIGLSAKDWIKLSQNPLQPLRNKTIQNHYAPGSIFKPFVALAALQTKIITADTLVYSPQKIIFNNRAYHDYRKTGHGMINLFTAIERSANVFFYKLGIKLGIDLMAKYAKLFGLGNKTNIRLTGEVAGLIPDTQWKTQHIGEKWQKGENLSHAIGQGFILVTPLQMALAYNALATDGQMVRPFIVKKVINFKNKELEVFSPQVLRTITQIDKKHFKTIKKALTQVVQGNHGTAKYWRVKDVPIAGKTGTSQVVSLSKKNIYKKCQARPLNQRHNGWFIAFAPADQPEIVVSVLTEHSCSGSNGSAPIAKDIIDFYFRNKKIKQRIQDVSEKTKSN